MHVAGREVAAAPVVEDRSMRTVWAFGEEVWEDGDGQDKVEKPSRLIDKCIKTAIQNSPSAEENFSY